MQRAVLYAQKAAFLRIGQHKIERSRFAVGTLGIQPDTEVVEEHVERHRLDGVRALRRRRELALPLDDHRLW